MRPLEGFLIFEVVMILLAIFLNKRPFGILLIPIILIINFIFHYIIEGIRWQMYFTYIIGLIAIIIYISSPLLKVKLVGKILLSFCVFFTFVSGVLSIVIPIFSLPDVTGDNAVGTSEVTFYDSGRNAREIKLTFWYPTNNTTQKRSAYCENPIKTFDGIFGFPGFLFSHLQLVRTAAIKDAKVLKPKQYPLVIYAHGGASVSIDNTTLLQEIASYGYFVMAVDFNFSFGAYGLNKEKAMSLNYENQKEFIDELIKKVLPNQVKDIQFTIKSINDKNFFLYNQIDFDKITLLGHSLGGTTALDASINSKNITSIINIDGPINPKTIERINKPVLYISSFSPNQSEEILAKKGLPDIYLYKKIKNAELENVHQLKNTITNFQWVRFKKAGHMDFTDVPFILPIMTTNGYDKYEGHQLKSILIINFLNHHLKNDISKKMNHNTIEWLH